jgi:5-methylcytosine-specific restriction endonuclease McrA
MTLKTLKSRLATAAPRISLADVSADSWRTGKTTTERGYGYAWQKRRAAHLAAHPLCVMCQAAGRVTTATVVDHITPHRGDKTLFDGPVQSLCKPHHDGEKRVIEHREDEARMRANASGL